jgi:hypothetical protein
MLGFVSFSPTYRTACSGRSVLSVVSGISPHHMSMRGYCGVEMTGARLRDDFSTRSIQHKPTMNRQELFSFAFKFFAMYLFANMLFALPMVLSTQTMVGRMLSDAGKDNPQLIAAWLVGGSIVVLGIIIAVILWRLSNSILSSTATGKIPANSSVLFSFTELQVVVIAGIGLFFTIDAIPSLGYYGVNMFNLRKDELDSTSVINFLFTLLQLSVAVSFVIYPRWWSNICLKPRGRLSSNE